jgi:hypothetical protein
MWPIFYSQYSAHPTQVIAAISGLLAVLSIPFMDETYAPVLHMKYDLASGDPKKIMNARRHLGPDVQLSRWKFLWINLSRPIVLLTRSFICFVLSLYMALIYGIYYLMFATFSGTCGPTLFCIVPLTPTPTELFSQTYGFGVGTAGLAYLGLGVGFILASVFSARFSDKVYAHYRAKSGGVGKPEMRIPTLIVGSFFIPIGLLCVLHRILMPNKLLTTFTVGTDGLRRRSSIGSCPSSALGYSALAL